MPFQDNSTMITTANLLTIANNNQVDTIQNPSGATAFSFTNGLSGDDTIRDFSVIDTLLNYKKIFDGNGDNIINIGSSSVLDIDRTSSTNAGPDQITLEGLANGSLRYLGSKQGYYVYADAKGRLSGFVEGTVGNNSFDASSTGRSYFYDTALGLNLGGDTITGFGADDRIVTTTAFYKGSDPRTAVTAGANGVFDLSGVMVNASDDSGATHGGQIDIVGVNALYLQGTSIANGVTYYTYGTVQQILNTPPTAPATKQVTTLEDTPSVAVAIGATDADSDALSYAIKSGEGPGKGGVSFDAIAGTFVYTPNANANGPDAFTIIISDGFGGIIEQRVAVTVTPVQDTVSPVNLANLGNTAGSRIIGQATDDRAGWSVSGAGDVNGDGLNDVIVGAFSSNANYTVDSGSSYVVFGQTSGGAIDLSQIAAGTGGFKINGEAREDFSGFSVSAIGDVNGDNLSDLLVGAQGNDSNGRGDNGAAYVVFGKASSAAVNLSDIAAGIGGFKILGEKEGDVSGLAVSGAGDVNGDGLNDIIVSAPGNNSNGWSDNGASYIVFGKSGTDTVDLADIASGSGGFKIDGEYSEDRSGYSVSGIGDMNGDGFADVMIGADLAGVYNNRPGSAYVVFGKSDTAAVNLADISLGVGGFEIIGEVNADHAGWAAASAGDVNGDGIVDLIIGSKYNNNDGLFRNGAAYVVFGKNDTQAIKLSDIAAGTGGFKILGENARDEAGISVSGAGDLNQDGYDDLLVGSPISNNTYVVFGKTSSTQVRLDDVAIGVGGFSLKGNNESAGHSLASAGDFNGDGLVDIIVGAPLHSVSATFRPGAAYVIYGSADWLI